MQPCDACGKVFRSQYHYTQHKARKTPCVKPVIHTPNTDITIESAEASLLDALSSYYDEVLNCDKSTYKSSNDEPTPIGCIREMIAKLPAELWSKTDLKILDPCCGNGNFAIPMFFELIKYHSRETVLGKILTLDRKSVV
jgi:hypothetical protein